MRSYHAVAIYLNGFHLLSLVPCVKQSVVVPRFGGEHIAMRGERFGEEISATKLGEEFFPSHQQYRDLLREYELNDSPEFPPLCSGQWQRLCESKWLRSVISLFAHSNH